MRNTPRTALQRTREGAESGLLAALLVLLVGGLGWWLDQPWLFSSLAPSIYLHVLTPERSGARPFPTFLGHLLGLIVGLVAVHATGAGDESRWSPAQPRRRRDCGLQCWRWEVSLRWCA